MHIRRILPAVALLVVTLVGPALAANFVDQPTVKKDGDKFVVSFSASEATDVAVTVRGDSGRAVRHLAAGLLGPKAPPPLKPDSLSQSLAWDGTDDAGCPVDSGKYSIEVALGLSFKFDKTFGDDPKAIDEIHGLGVGPEGELYVMSASGRDNLDGRFQLFDAKGGYVRTIMPRPGDLPADRVKPFNDIVLADGSRVPRTMLPYYEWRSFQQPLVMPDGDLVFANARMRSEASNGTRYTNHLLGPEPKLGPFDRRLLRIANDGGAPRKASFVGPLLGPNMEGQVYLAASPDAKIIYISGNRHAIFSAAWEENGKLTPLIGTPDRPGDGEAGLKEPCGIDTDSAGNIYVADRGNHRIAVFDAKGKFVGQLKVEWPELVRVHPDGRIFVVAGFKERSLLRFEKLAADKPGASMPLGVARLFLAIDKHAKSATLYVGNVNANAANRGGKLVRVEDGDAGLKAAAIINSDAELIQPFMIGVDRQRELAYAKRTIYGQYVRIDGHTGKAENFNLPMNPKSNGIFEMTAGADGTLIGHVAHEFAKLDATLRPTPFGPLGSYLTVYANEDGPRSNLAKDCTIAPNGDIYWLHERGGYSKPMLCSVLGPDGKEKKSPLIEFYDCSAAGIRVDRQGNVYTLNHVKPVGKLVPDELAGKTGTERTDQHVYKYGSVLKWKPAGGAIRLVAPGPVKKRDVPAGQFQLTTAEGRGDFQAEGVQWMFFGVSNILPNYQREGCHCWTPRFDVDEYGRAFVPDQALNRIIVLDSSGNVITKFGQYGNIDNTKASPAGVPFGDPRTVVASDEAAYVGDQTNNCVVRAKLEYYVSASADATVAGKPADLAEALQPIRAEIIKVVPAAEKVIDWAAISRSLAANASSPDAALAVVMATRQGGLSDADRAKLLTAMAVDDSPYLRAAAALAEWGRADKPSIEFLTAALKDTDAMVRVVAADALLTMNNGTGLVEVLKALTSEDPNIFALAQNAFTRKVLDGENSRYPIGKEEAAALGDLLVRTNVPEREKNYWFTRSTAIRLLGQSGRAEGIDPLIATMQFDAGRYGGKRNMCRCIDALGKLRAKKAVPELLKFVARGTIVTDNSNFGDTAEQNAANALAEIADPQSVAPLIDMLASDKKNSASLALRALSRMFNDSGKELPADRVLMPKEGKFELVRVDELPTGGEIQKAWRAFWAANESKYEYNPAAPGLKRK